MKHKPFSPFDVCSRKKLLNRKKSLTRKQLKHLYEMALIEESNLNAEKQTDFEKF